MEKTKEGRKNERVSEISKERTLIEGVKEELGKNKYVYSVFIAF